MKSIRGRISVVLLALVCLFTSISNSERAAWDCPECGRKGNTGNFCGNCAHPAPEAGPVLAEGDIISFGHYEQDNNLNNGPEAIEWIVLDYDAAERKALLLSQYGLDVKQYHESWDIITWEKCGLRSWLNGEFLGTAFTSEEQRDILLTNVDNSRNQGYREWNTDGGNDTEDKIFLLSYWETFEEYFEDNKSRICKPTAYAMAHGALVNRDSGNCWWWLRSPGNYQYSAMCVLSIGSRLNFDAYDKSGCVRPTLWLNLNSEIF